MLESPDILKVRVLLCFSNEETKLCTVTNIARVLGEEKYTISRVLAGLEKDGYVNRECVRHPQLTKLGISRREYYAERVNCVTDYLTQKGVDVASARHDALHWALYSSQASMELLRESQEKLRVKQQIKGKRKFSGLSLCKTMADGVYQFNFLIYRECVCGGNMMSMANAGFENPCTLSVNNGVGLLHLRTCAVSGFSALSGKKMCGLANTLKYYDNGEYITAEKRGNVFTIPASVLNFICIGSAEEKLLHGSVQIKIGCSAGIMHMPESTAVFTVII